MSGSPVAAAPVAGAGKVPSDILAELVATVSGDGIPDAVRTCIEECILDFVGNVVYASAQSESSVAFRTGARNMDPQGNGYTVIGERSGFGRGAAAFLNGAFAHSMDFDDTNHYGALHPAAPIIPAALVCAEENDVDGRLFVDAVAVGYEVACRIGGALGTTAYDRGFHNTSVAGIFGAVAAAGRLRGLDQQQIATAFGIAGSLAAGSLQCLEDGTWNKRLHPGFAASNALQAIVLAEAGVKAAADPLTGKYGLLAGYSNTPKPQMMTSQLGKLWVAGQTAIKPYPCCRFNHSTIDAALRLRERFNQEQRELVSLHLVISQKAYDIVGVPQPGKLAPRTVVDGQFSIYFQLALAWLFGEVNTRSYARIGDEQVEAFIRRIQVTPNPRGTIGEAHLSVDGVEGALVKVMIPSGEHITPLGRPRIKAKFVDLASPIFGAEEAGLLADRLLNLRNHRSTAALISELRHPEAARRG